jgi:hypothetical protein
MRCGGNFRCINAIPDISGSSHPDLRVLPREFGLIRRFATRNAGCDEPLGVSDCKIMQRLRSLCLDCSRALWLSTVVSGWRRDENGEALEKSAFHPFTT